MDLEAVTAEYEQAKAEPLDMFRRAFFNDRVPELIAELRAVEQSVTRIEHALTGKPVTVTRTIEILQPKRPPMSQAEIDAWEAHRLAERKARNRLALRNLLITYTILMAVVVGVITCKTYKENHYAPIPIPAGRHQYVRW